MALEKMQGLAEHLRSYNLFAAEQMDSWMEKGQADYANKKIGKNILLCRFRYDAVISVERFSQSADLFLALVSMWLMEFDTNRGQEELPMPGIDVNPLDDTTVDLELTVTFVEEIIATPDANGVLVINGIRYGVGNTGPVHVAKKIGVGDSQARTVDNPYVRAD